MKLYFIWQEENRDYDTYSDAIVCAESEEEARNTHPSGHDWDDYGSKSWCKSPDQVKVKYIGEAAPDINKGVMCASFHAG